MQNVTPSMLKTSIFMTSDDSLDTNILHAKLTGYFDVKEITSIHSDDCDCIGVWITYKD